MTMRCRLVPCVAACALALALLSGCGASGGATPSGTAPADQPKSPPAQAAAPAQVVIDNFAFQPTEITVPAGTKVTWVNRDDVPHTATSTAKPKAFDSGTLDTDQTFSRVFDKPGVYEYFCAVHPKMTGRVVVK
jgi:plastocyanin